MWHVVYNHQKLSLIDYSRYNGKDTHTAKVFYKKKEEKRKQLKGFYSYQDFGVVPIRFN